MGFGRLGQVILGVLIVAAIIGFAIGFALS
jgi:hypothetical protein